MLERLLIVGLGSAGKRHARLARQVAPGAQIVALRRRVSSDVVPGVDRCVTSLPEALSFNPQAAVIANPASHHLRMAKPLSEAGVHLLIEKPISSTIQGVAGLLDGCRAQGLTVVTGYNLRYLLSLQRFRLLVHEKRVGRVLSVRAVAGQFLPTWRPGVDYRETVSARAALGGGVLLELSHEIDYLRWIFGDVEWVSAIQCRLSSLEIDVDDTAHLVMGFVPQSGGSSVVAAVNMDFVRHDTTRTCTVIGETGSLRWNAIAGTVEVFEKDGDCWTTLFTDESERDASYLAEWRDFLSSIETGDPPVVSGHDGMAVIQLIEAARRSVETRSVVSVGPTERGRDPARAET